MAAQLNQPVNPVVDGISGAARIAASLLTPNLRSQRSHWGATIAEWSCRFPGDERVPEPKWSYTHAITVHAPPSHIWPWLAQIGRGRGGLYSYESLENLVGSHIHNADQLLPEFQQITVGDPITLHPSAPALQVAAVEPGHSLLLVGKQEESTEISGDADDYKNVSWLFILDDQHDGTTRLITRYRIDYAPTLANRLGFGPLLIEPISFVMERKMLLGIKTRAEASRSALN